jgi:biopolymer transport protein ExbB/TolQ
MFLVFLEYFFMFVCFCFAILCIFVWLGFFFGRFFASIAGGEEASATNPLLEVKKLARRCASLAERRPKKMQRLLSSRSDYLRLTKKRKKLSKAFASHRQNRSITDAIQK